MVPRFLPLFCLVCLCSCATLVNRKDYVVTISTNAGVHAQVQVQDNLYQVPARVRVRRSKEDLPVTVFNDTLAKEFLVKSSPSPAFLLNLVLMQAAPFCFLIDYTTPRRFYYGSNIYLNVVDTTHIIRTPVASAFHTYFSRKFPSQEGQLNLLVSLPHANSFHLKPPGEPTKNNTGFWGFSTGMEYYYKKNKFMAVAAHAVTDIFLPVPAAVTLYGEHQRLTSVYVSLTDNFRFNRTSLGYGLSYGRNIWSLSYNEDYDPQHHPYEFVQKSTQAIGTMLNGYYHFGNTFCMGLIYRPTFLQVYPGPRLTYEHLISLDLAWKIKLK